ncbi:MULTISPECIES: anti-sigma factor [Ralstonia]|jgi:anti-sigma-K factor RskA|uniref:Anti-sigma factor n=1 Tax=Ralstonia chuxiongensis TaxID=2957504 RepID=A0AA42BI69_9RALS|nr:MULTISPECIES: anti-sigma factor [Ralstonia]MCP1173684.1 anti-sigma factor [Ralstonia chuxiongensis]HWV06644.1 anti-sigma factor [Ralstonia sp.]
MDPRRHPDLVDKLAAEYAVGTLRAGARRRFEQIIRHDDAVRATVERWQRYLADLPALQPATAPLPEILCRVEVQLGWREPAPPRQALWQRLWQGTGFWRGATAAAAVIAAVAIGLNLRLAQQLREAPVANAVAVLQDAKAQAAVLVTWDARTGTLSLKRLDATPLNTEQALQLWALPPGGHPQSLGVIGHQRAVRLTVAQPLRQVPALAISVEPRGGSPNPEGPTGPVVFKGALIDNTL